jgi:hypothetical protein
MARSDDICTASVKAFASQKPITKRAATHGLLRFTACSAQALNNVQVCPVPIDTLPPCAVWRLVSVSSRCFAGPESPSTGNRIKRPSTARVAPRWECDLWLRTASDSHYGSNCSGRSPSASTTAPSLPPRPSSGYYSRCWHCTRILSCPPTASWTRCGNAHRRNRHERRYTAT